MLSKVNLNKTPLSVSRLCYGTNMFGTVLGQERANELLDTFVAAGGNFIDTARSYGDWVPNVPKGASERTIGAWLARRSREGLVIATKGAFFDLRAGNWAPRVNPQGIATDINESLEHLQLDHIDLWWLHADDPAQPVEPIIDALISQQQSGRIRYFGASNWSVARINAAQSYAKSIGHDGFVAIQPFWGLAVPNRDAAMAQGYGPYYDDGYAPVHASGLPMIPYSGQSRGFFTKLASGGEKNLPEHLAAMYLNETNRKRAKAVEVLAARRGVAVNEIVLAYLLSQPLPTLPIIGASSPRQISESLKAADIKLTAAELEQLRADA
jgi:aryl-alcohol dehydrogenase-like predicted oxidoreductase